METYYLLFQGTKLSNMISRTPVYQFPDVNKSTRFSNDPSKLTSVIVNFVADQKLLPN